MSMASEGPILKEWKVTIGGTPIYVMKLPDDPIAKRASLGGTALEGYYLAYRGDEDEIERLLECCLKAFLLEGGTS